MKKTENGNIATHSVPMVQGIQSGKWYQTINEIPLNKFIDCLVDDNLSALIISGIPQEELLLIAWANINEQYADAMGDNDHRLYNKLFKDITLLKIDYRQIQVLLEVLSMYRYKPFEIRLNELLYTNFLFTEYRQKELDTCFRLSKSLIVKADLKTEQFNAIKEKMGKGSRPTREFFYTWLINLSDFARYQIPDTITVFEWCERIKRLNKFVEDNQKQKNGGRSHR